MKKIRQNSKKGFTLVELIVVLVILAVMAAMLVPALTGYIDEARKKKDYNAASEVLTAAQSAVAKYYGEHTDATPAGAQAYLTSTEGDAFIDGLTGINSTISAPTVSDTYVITNITVQLPGGNSYTWNGSTWS